MKSNSVVVTGEGQGFDEALSLTEKIGEAQGLDKKSVIRLRLLAEELFGLLRGIAGEVSATYRLVYENKRFELHMKSNVSMTEAMRDQFLSASSTGRNDAAKGFMGRLRVMIGNALLASKEALPYAAADTVFFYSADGMVQSVPVWSMLSYRQSLQKHADENEETREAWDELEKSIVANIADDVRVKVVGSSVEILVLKAF